MIQIFWSPKCLHSTVTVFSTLKSIFSSAIKKRKKKECFYHSWGYKCQTQCSFFTRVSVYTVLTKDRKCAYLGLVYEIAFPKMPNSLLLEKQPNGTNCLSISHPSHHGDRWPWHTHGHTLWWAIATKLRFNERNTRACKVIKE